MTAVEQALCSLHERSSAFENGVERRNRSPRIGVEDVETARFVNLFWLVAL